MTFCTLTAQGTLQDEVDGQMEEPIDDCSSIQDHYQKSDMKSYSVMEGDWMISKQHLTKLHRQNVLLEAGGQQQ